MNPLIEKLAQQIEVATAEQKTLLAAAETENRDLTEDEAKRFDELTAQIDKDKAAHAAAVKRASAVAANVEWLREPARPPVTQREQPHNPHAGGSAPIPANVRRVANLRAFSGARAQEDAYQSGLFVLGALMGHAGSRARYEERYGPLATTLSTTSNPNGAYLVPDVMDFAIVKLTEEYGVARRACRIQPMSSDTWSGPRWTGVLTAYFVAEGSAPSASEQTYDRISLTAKNLAAKGKMTRNLAEDAVISIGDEWAEAAGIAFAEKEDQCLFNGDGASTYGSITGLLTKLTTAANAASLFTATGHTTLAALTIGDYNAVVGLLPSYPGIRPSWYVHKTVWANSMSALQLAAGGATPMDIQAGGKPQFLGYPVEFVNVLTRATSVTTGVTGIVFGDLSMSAAFGDRRQRTFETGMENDDFSKQLLTMLATERFDINVHTVVDPKNSSNPGPVIGLKLG